jgi:hypothetical protein
VYSLLFVMFALGSRSVIIAYKIVQRLVTRCLNSPSRMHNAFHSGAIINHVMRKMTQVNPKRGLIRRMKLMDQPEDG